MPLARRALLITLPLLFALVGGLYSLAVPPWEAPDEPAHYEYVVDLVNNRALPRMQPRVPTEAHQPPLYYLTVAPFLILVGQGDPRGSFQPNPRFIWAAQGGQEPNASIHGTVDTFPPVGMSRSVHVARMASLLAGVATVFAVVLLSLTLFPTRWPIALLAGSLTAFNPQFAFIGGVLNNDALVAAICSLTALATWRAAEQPYRKRRWVLVGAIAGLAIMTKMTAIFLVPFVGLTILFCALHHRSVQLILTSAFATLASFLVIAGWWFIRNQQIYGDPLGRGMFDQIYFWNKRFSPLTLADVESFSSKSFRSFWGAFGWVNVFLPEWMYSAAMLISIGVVFWIVPVLWRRTSTSPTPGQRAGLVWLFLFVLMQAMVIALIAVECGESCYQGRYFFASIAGISILIAFSILGFIPERRAGIVAMVLSALLLSNSIYVLTNVLAPAYPVKTMARGAANQVPQNLGVRIGEQFGLLGYDIATAGTDGRIVVTLYWTALGRPNFDYSAFVHLIDREGQLLAQKDHAPGELDGYKPTSWAIGDVVRDHHEFVLPPGSSNGRRLRLGLYNWATGEQLPVFKDGAAVGTFLIVELPELR